MTDEELIAKLRERPFRLGFESEEQAKTRRQREREAAADRIEALVREKNYWIERCGRERAFASSHRVRAERLEAERNALIAVLADCPIPQVAEEARTTIARLKGDDHDAG